MGIWPGGWLHLSEHKVLGGPRNGRVSAGSLLSFCSVSTRRWGQGLVVSGMRRLCASPYKNRGRASEGCSELIWTPGSRRLCTGAGAWMCVRVHMYLCGQLEQRASELLALMWVPVSCKCASEIQQKSASRPGLARWEQRPSWWLILAFSTE